ncbi:hypothetical protein [Alteromonas lipotrueae]|uniref:hypothetical protein n=1 Tax=Alteromonas lipotrueae TaxID=2803814 RepID=UPI001C476517|nr:hypothetical protein [Alteromonas lipotrueae]
MRNSLFWILLICLLQTKFVFAAKAKYVSGTESIKETLSIFSEEQGVNLEIDGNKKLATISLLKDVTTENIFQIQIIGKFEGTDTALANEEGLVNDATLKITKKHIFFTDEITNDIEIAESRARGLRAIRNKLDSCAFSVIPPKDLKTKIARYFDSLKDENKMLASVGCAELLQERAAYQKNTNEIRLYRAYSYLDYSFAYTPGDYKYFDVNDEEVRKSDTESFTLGAEYGYISISSSEDTQKRKLYPWDSYKLALAVDYVKGDAKLEKNKTNICQLVPENSSLTRCFDTYLQPAFENENLSAFATIGIRARESWLYGAELVVKKTWIEKTFVDESSNIDQSRWSVELPITLFVTKKYDVRAGLNFSWQEKLKTDNADFDEFTVGLFVTKGFDFEI